MTTNTQDQITLYTTAALGVIGSLLAIANEIKDIPALAPYSNYAVLVIGFAVTAKQIIQIIQKHIGKPPTQ